MNVQSINNTSFKGYDARPLKGFFMGAESQGVLNEMQNIGKKEGFKIYTKLRNVPHQICGEYMRGYGGFETMETWAQDLWTFCKRKLLTSSSNNAQKIANYFGASQTHVGNHLAGGNFFIVNNNGEDELIVGKDALEKFTLDDLKKIYEVNKVHILPQMDFHIDLFIRPLDKKRVLVADDNLSLQILKKGLNDFKTYTKDKGDDKSFIANLIINRFNELISKFKTSVSTNIRPQVEEIVKVLNVGGFEPIRVPGRIYDTLVFNQNDVFITHDCNYINANVLLNNDGELVYITNKSNIDSCLGLDADYAEDFGFRFEKEFIKSIEPYVRPDKIYFVDGENYYISKDLLKNSQGGVHCLCAEIPLEVKEND